MELESLREIKLQSYPSYLYADIAEKEANQITGVGAVGFLVSIFYIYSVILTLHFQMASGDL